MKELVLGKIRSQELADWFGISYSTYRKKKETLLSELNYYCDYEVYHGGITVKEIFIKDYRKNLASEDSDTYLQLVKESNGGFCSLAGMARKLTILYPGTWGQYSETTVRNRLRKVGIAMFGETNLPSDQYDEDNERFSGPFGYKEYCWAIKVSDFNEYRYLTEEEDKVFEQLLDSYNISSKDIALKEQIDKEMKDQLQQRQITIEEYIAGTAHIELFPQLLSKFKELTGEVLVHATKHDLLDSAF